MSLTEQLRAWCIAVRRKPSPIADAIPMVNKAADELDRLTDDYAAATHLLADRDAHIERLKAELATLRAAAASVQADQRAEIDAANAVIDELIACKGWKEWTPRSTSAWEAARALRKGTTCC